MENRVLRRVFAVFLSVLLVACLLPLIGTTEAKAATGVKSISFKPVTTEYEEGAIGWTDSEQGFFVYNVFFKEGDQFTVNWNDGSSSVYTYTEYYDEDQDEYYQAFECPGKASIDPYSIDVVDDQYETHWQVGNTYPVTYYYRGKSTTVKYSVKENSVKSIKYEPVKSELIYDEDGDFVETESGVQYFNYDVYFKPGDKLTINWTSGKTSEYICVEEEEEKEDGWYVHYYFKNISNDGNVGIIYEDDLLFFNDQYEDHWDIGEHGVEINYNGRSYVITYKVVEDTGLIFWDVDRGNNFYDEINWMANVGLTTGFPDGSYQPWKSVNRAAVVTFIWRMEGEPEPSKMAAFKDMPTNNEDFMKAISWASEEGITTGYADGTFRPWKDCNRAAIVTFLWRYQGKPTVPEKAEFKDPTKNSDFDAAISWASYTGITNGYDDNTFRPWKNCHRAAMAAFLSRM